MVRVCAKTVVRADYRNLYATTQDPDANDNEHQHPLADQDDHADCHAQADENRYAQPDSRAEPDTDAVTEPYPEALIRCSRSLIRAPHSALLSG